MRPLRLIRILKYPTATELRAALFEGLWKEHPSPTVYSMDKSTVSDLLGCIFEESIDSLLTLALLASVAMLRNTHVFQIFFLCPFHQSSDTVLS